MRTKLFRELTAALLSGLLLLQAAQAGAPGWWSTQRVINPAKQADDYAVLNQGQLKNLIRAVVSEMNVELPGGAGLELNALLETWRVQRSTSDDYAVVTIGQLKAAAHQVRKRLEEAGVDSATSWSPETSDDDDFAVANVGQAKQVFRLFLPNAIMMAAVDSDQDGFTDLDEFWSGTGIHDSASVPNGGLLSPDYGASTGSGGGEEAQPTFQPKFVFYYREKSDFGYVDGFAEFDVGDLNGAVPSFYTTRTRVWTYSGSQSANSSGAGYSYSQLYAESIVTSMVEHYPGVRTASGDLAAPDHETDYVATDLTVAQGEYSWRYRDFNDPMKSTSYSGSLSASGSMFDETIVTTLSETFDYSDTSNELSSSSATWQTYNFPTMVMKFFASLVHEESDRTATSERSLLEYEFENHEDNGYSTGSLSIHFSEESQTTLSGKIAISQVASNLKSSLAALAWPDTFEPYADSRRSRCDVSFHGWNIWAVDVEYYVALEWPEDTPQSVKEQDLEPRDLAWTETYEAHDGQNTQTEIKTVSLRPGEKSATYLLSAVNIDATRSGTKGVGEPEKGLRAHEILADGSISSSRANVQPSVPSPVIGMKCELSNVHIGADGQIMGDLALSDGTITSTACDTIKGAKGKITKAQLWVNNADEPHAQINVTATKEEDGPHHQPYPYSGAFEQVISNVPLTAGTNVFKVTAEDEVYHVPGYNTWVVNVEISGPDDEEVDPVLYAGMAGVTERLGLEARMSQPSFDGAAPDSLEAILDLNGDLLPPLTLTETGDDTHVFTGALADGLAVRLTLDSAEPPGASRRDMLHADLVLGQGASAVTRSLTLGENSADSGIFSGGQRVTTFSVASPGISAPGAGVPAAPPPPVAGAASSSLTITTGDAVLLQHSNGGEFHQYALAVSLPADMVNRTVLKIGERTLRLRHDEASDLNVVEDPEHEGEPLLCAFRAPEDAAGPQPDDKKLYKEMRDHDYLYGFMIGFKSAGVDMITDSLGIIKGAGMYVLRSYAGISIGAKLIWQKLTDSDEVYETEEQFIQLGEEQDAVHQDVIEVAKFLNDFVAPLAPLGPTQLQLQIDLLTGAWQGNLGAAAQTALNGSETHRRVFSLVSGALAEMKNDYKDGTPGQRGYITGRIVFEAASMVFAYTKLGKLAQLKKAAFLEKILSTKIPGPNMRKAFRPLIVALKKTKMCFVAGTLVRTLAGLLPIEQVRAGTYVWSRDEETGQMGWKRVVQTFTTHPSVIHHLTYELRGPPSSASVPLAADESAASRRLALPTETFGVTAPHPFYVRNRETPGFIAAEELVPGDELFISGHRQAVVVSNTIENESGGETFTTYNFEVEDYHTYFVGSNGVWVHNSGGFNCDELFEIWYLKLKHFEGDHWNAFKNLMVDPPPAWASWPERWRLRGFNEVRLDWFTSPSPGSTPPPWRNALVNRPGAVKSAEELAKNINAALGFTKKPEGFTAHHIVMTVTSESNEYWKRMKKLSEEGQDILRRNGNIDINDAANGTYLPSTGAKTADFADDVYGPRHMAPGETNFHTEAYLTAVIEELRKVDGLGRDAVTDKLQEIAARIIERDFPGIPRSS